MSDRPWTSGPWRWDEGYGYASTLHGLHGRILGGGTSSGVASFKQADADLIALAPEMAEAILTWEFHDGVYGYGYPAVAMLRECVEKLSQIGNP